MSMEYLSQTDPEILDALRQELNRQRSCIELIASENFTSRAVLETCGSVLTNKYAEGYPGKRYYGGCEKVDIVENLARERACALFGSAYANVQPHCGSSANMIAYQAMCEPGDTILGMNLSHGGHLTHGAPVSFSGKLYQIYSYGVHPETETIDYDALERIAKEVRPKVIVGGASAYPRTIDFERMAQIAHEVGAYLMIDIAHIAGLIAGGVHPSCVPHADITTSTSHKTLRGPRGGFLLTNNEELYQKINKAAFPGCQGGPLMHVIAAKAVVFGEAMTPEYRTYAADVVKNCAAMAEALAEGGLRLVSGGTDNHLCLVDLTAAGVTGKEAEVLLESVGLTANKNSIPNEKLSPFITSGIRLGSAAGTTRGFDEDDFRLIGEMIAAIVFDKNNEELKRDIRKKVDMLLEEHPLYPGLEY